MRDVKRIFRIVQKVGQLWMIYPDLRFFQFFSLLHHMVRREFPDIDLYFLEDDLLENMLDDFIRQGRSYISKFTGGK